MNKEKNRSPFSKKINYATLFSLNICPKIFFSPFSLKIICFRPKLHFVHISILEFEWEKREKESLKNNREKRKRVNWLDSIDKNDQIWCQSILIDERNVIVVFLGFHVIEKGNRGWESFFPSWFCVHVVCLLIWGFFVLGD